MSAFTGAFSARLTITGRALAVAILIGGIVGMLPGLVMAQSAPPFQFVGANVQKRANSVLSIMTYTLMPDVTTSSLSIDSQSTGNPGLMMTQFGGGFTFSKSTPLYLEGNAAYSRYDPTFVVSNGQEERSLPLRWNSLTLSGGIGWDFPVAKDWVIRPIFNIALGRVESDLLVARQMIEHRTGAEFDFLDGGGLSAAGYGGSIMLDYESFEAARDIDLELRYMHIRLDSIGGTSNGVRGHADSQVASLYARRRAPTGMTALQRPVRYVLELAYSNYLSGDTSILGFDRLMSVGAGLELDTSAYDIFVTRARMVARYVFGNNVSGVSLGFAVSF